METDGEIPFKGRSGKPEKIEFAAKVIAFNISDADFERGARTLGDARHCIQTGCAHYTLLGPKSIYGRTYGCHPISFFLP